MEKASTEENDGSRPGLDSLKRRTGIDFAAAVESAAKAQSGEPGPQYPVLVDLERFAVGDDVLDQKAQTTAQHVAVCEECASIVEDFRRADELWSETAREAVEIA